MYVLLQYVCPFVWAGDRPTGQIWDARPSEAKQTKPGQPLIHRGTFPYETGRPPLIKLSEIFSIFNQRHPYSFPLQLWLRTRRSPLGPHWTHMLNIPGIPVAPGNNTEALVLQERINHRSQRNARIKSHCIAFLPYFHVLVRARAFLQCPQHSLMFSVLLFNSHYWLLL